MTDLFNIVSLAAHGLFWRTALGAGRLVRGAAGNPAPAMSVPPGDGGLVVYAGTVGELNAIRPLLDRLVARWPAAPLAILTAQHQYIEPMRRAYPGAAVGLPPSAGAEMGALFRALRPRVVIVAEGPAVAGRFPYEMDLGLFAGCLAAGVPAFVVNATLYDFSVSSRLFRWEHALFGSLPFRAIRGWYAASPAERDDLVAAGVPPDRIAVVGDLKFDMPDDSTPAQGELARLLDFYRGLPGPVLVGGNVNEPDEQAAFIAAWRQLRAAFPDSRMIVAPRYLQYDWPVGNLVKFLGEAGMSFARRTDGVEAAMATDALIVDVFGELRHFYGVATIAYAGRNHGVLEPTRLGRPTVVSAGWKTGTPSYQIYRNLVDNGALAQVPDPAALGGVLVGLATDPDWRSGLAGRATAVFAAQRGATDRTLSTLVPMIESGRPVALATA